MGGELMFETAISTAALSGVELHDRDGKTFWKLLKTCGECGTVMDDECMCFSTEETMLKAKARTFYCSAKCWFINLPVKQQMKEMEDFKEAADAGYWCLEGDAVRRMPQADFLEEMYEFLSDSWDNACCDSMTEVCDADLECPIIGRSNKNTQQREIHRLGSYGWISGHRMGGAGRSRDIHSECGAV